MKHLFKAFFAIALSASVLTSCNKEGDAFDPLEQLEIEKVQIKEYVEKNYPNAQQYEDTGLWYEIMEPGEADSYTYKVTDAASGQKWINAEGIVNYRGKLVSNGTVFDETQDPTKGTTLPIRVNLNTGDKSVITAWIHAFTPKTIKVGEQDTDIGIIFTNGAQTGAKFRIITPSIYAYGNQVYGKIPANSPLDFEIEVLKMQDYNPTSGN